MTNQSESRYFVVEKKGLFYAATKNDFSVEPVLIKKFKKSEDAENRVAELESEESVDFEVAMDERNS